jgi:hypothetical protein
LAAWAKRQPGRSQRALWRSRQARSRPFASCRSTAC